MDKAERFVRSSINFAASRGEYEVAIQESLIPKELLEQLKNEHYNLKRWKDNIVINWSVVGRA